MANLTESATFDANIYRIDQNDPVLGWDGSNDNIANLQAKALANRTQYLKKLVDLGARFTIIKPVAIASNGQVVNATPDDLNGSLVRINTVNGPTCDYQLMDAGTVADGANVTISHEVDSTFVFINTNTNGIFLKAFTGQNIIDLKTGIQANTHILLPMALYKVIKINATLWGLLTLQEEVQQPAGMVAAWARETPPIGWLDCSGQAISRTTYARLFANIGTTFGNGNGTTTFNIPDLRAEFIRGWDNGRGVDGSRAFGSAQAEAVNTAGVQLREASTTWAASGAGVGSSQAYFGNSNITSYGTNMTLFGGTETRPRNVALMFCIKY